MNLVTAVVKFDIVVEFTYMAGILVFTYLHSHTHRFRNNSSPSTGGGLHMSFLREGEQGYDNRVILVDSQFVNNQANYGGGVYFLPIGELSVNQYQGIVVVYISTP